MTAPRSRIVDMQSVAEYAESYHEDGPVIVEQFPSGVRLEAKITLEADPWVYVKQIADRRGECRKMRLVEATSTKFQLGLQGAKLIWARSQGCPTIDLRQDGDYTLNYGSPQGILRVRIGTRSPLSRSRFHTSVALHPISMGRAFYDENVIWTKIDCTPSVGHRTELPELVKKVLSHGQPCDRSW